MKRVGTRIIVLVAAGMASIAAVAALPWPVEPADQDKDLLSVIEYKNLIRSDGTEQYYIHPGIDIFANSSDDSSPSAILTVAPSIPVEVGCDDPSVWNLLKQGCSPFRANGCWAALAAQDASGYRFNYGHLDCRAYDVDFMNAYENQTSFAASKKIGTVQRWDVGCGNNPVVYPSHLHIEVFDPATSMLLLRNDDPTLLFEPFGNSESPRISDVHFGADDANMTAQGWSAFAAPAVTGTCLRVDGDVDVIVGYECRHRAGGSDRHGDNLGARFVRYRFCGGTDPDCAWQPSYDWSKIPYYWSEPNLIVEAAYSVDPPFPSKDSFVCSDDAFYAVPTNIVQEGGQSLPDRAGAWKTTSATANPKADEQHFTVSVEVEDFSGAVTSQTIPVCVARSAGPGVSKLLVRDCDGDDGSEPSPCTVWSESPDISILPVVSPPPAVSLQVCMRNIGNAAIPAASQVTIELRAEKTTLSGAIPFSGSADRIVSALTTRTGGAPGPSDWSPGEDRCTAIDWPPSTAPSDWNTYDRLSASVARDGDTPNTFATAQYDNNRAEHGTDFLAPAPVGDLRRTDIATEKIDSERPWHSIAIERVRTPPDFLREAFEVRGPVPPSPCDIQVHVGPGATFGAVVGGIVVGTMSEEDHAAWNPVKPLVPGDPGLQLLGGDDARIDPGTRADVWRVITIPAGVDVTSLESPAARGNSTLSVFVWPKGGAGAKNPPAFLVRVFAKGVHPGKPVEVFQRVVRPSDLRERSIVRPR